MCSESALQVGGERRLQIFLELLDGRRARPRAISEARRTGQAEVGGKLDKPRRQLRNRLGAVPHERESVTGELLRPSAERSRGGYTGADSGQQAVALSKRPCVFAARIPPRGPECRHHLVEMSSARA